MHVEKTEIEDLLSAAKCRGLKTRHGYLSCAFAESGSGEAAVTVKRKSQCTWCDIPEMRQAVASPHSRRRLAGQLQNWKQCAPHICLMAMADSALPRVNTPGAVALLNDVKDTPGSAYSYVVGSTVDEIMEIE